jgi:hypothetical protein
MSPTHNVQPQQRKPKWDRTDVTDALREAIHTDPFVTCTQLRAIVRERTSVEISRQLTSVALKGLGFSKVKTRLRHFDNSKHVPKLRDFMQALCTCLRRRGTIVAAVDECGFDARMNPQHGYAKTGERLHLHDHRSRSWKRHNVIMCATSDGQWSHSVQTRPVNRFDFAGFISDLPYPPGTVVVMDNVAFHKSACVTDALASKKYVPLFIPPYCPNANPIENIFGIVKQRFRRNWSRKLQAITPAINNTIAGVMESLESVEKVFVRAIVWMRERLAVGTDDVVRSVRTASKTYKELSELLLTI